MTPDVSPARRAAASVVISVALFLAVVVQLTVVNRLSLPGGAAPDLVLLLVTAVAVTVSPLTAATCGFFGGLALDIAPPDTHYAGEYALIFCLACYGAARAVRVVWELAGISDARITLACMAAAVAAGEGGKAALGLLLSQPDVTVPAIGRELPAAALGDLLLAPVVYWLVSRCLLAWLTRAAVFPFSRDPAASPVTTGRVPRLRLAGTGADYERPPAPRRVPKLPLASAREKYQRPSGARGVPKLRLGGASAVGYSRTAWTGSGGGPLNLAGGRRRRLRFAGDLRARTAPRRAWPPARKALPPARRKSTRGHGRTQQLLRMVGVGR